jgi:hypothetical protein
MTAIIIISLVLACIGLLSKSNTKKTAAPKMQHFRVATGCCKSHSGFGRPIYTRPQRRVLFFFWVDIWPEYLLFNGDDQVESWVRETYGNNVVFHKSVWRDFYK